MKKAIAITIKPQHLVNILNGTKTLEIRKNKVLYNAIKKMIAEEGKATIVAVCSKGKELLTFEYASVDDTYQTDYPCGYKAVKKLENNSYIKHEGVYNGKVVCSWECDRVEDIDVDFGRTYDFQKFFDKYDYYIKKMGYSTQKICKIACLTTQELDNYLNGQIGYAIPIQNLNIFDKSKEIGELKQLIGYWDFGCLTKPIFASLKKAPQNMAYVGVKL